MAGVQNETEINITENKTADLYEKLKLEETICYKAFEQAFEGFYSIKKKQKNVLTVIDFSKPSTEKRMCVIDLDKEKVLHISYVAHGKNSGGKYATSFSNKTGSHKSSLGFYLTEQTYDGKNGYSLILDGLEKGINDKAKERAIVVHAAEYANPSNIKSSGRLGRSFGCPALPENVNKKIIDAIKGGSVMYIYANSSTYLAQSNILKGDSRAAKI